MATSKRKSTSDTLLRRIRGNMAKKGVKPGLKLTAAEIREFERAHGIKLPEEYATFLREIGNGAICAANNEFDLRKLGKVRRGRGLERAALANARAPFTQSSSDPKGCLPIGGTEYEVWVLVITGKERGKVWQLAPDGPPAGNRPPRNFLAWYDHWLSSNAADGWWDEPVDEKAIAAWNALRNLDPIRAQRDALDDASHVTTPREADRALDELGKVVDPSLQGHAQFLRAVCAAVKKQPDAESLALQAAENWLGPAVVGAVNQGPMRSDVIELLGRFKSTAAKQAAERVRVAPEPMVAIPEGDFF